MPLRRNRPRHLYTLWGDQLETIYAEKDLGVLVNNKLTMSWQRTILAKKANSFLGCIKQRIASRSKKVILSLYLVLDTCWVQFWPPHYKILIYWSESRAALQTERAGTNQPGDENAQEDLLNVHS